MFDVISVFTCYLTLFAYGIVLEYYISNPLITALAYHIE